MINEYDIVWRWKQKEYLLVNRLYAKLVDLFIVYIVTFGLEQFVNVLSIDLNLQMKYRLFILIYFVYELLLFLILKTTLGKMFFNLHYMSRDHEQNVNQFVIRMMSYLVLVIISIEIKTILPFLIYYIIKAFDKFSGPYWDSKIKVKGSNQYVMPKYIVTIILVVVIMAFSLSNETLLGDYMKGYTENSIESQLVIGVFEELVKEEIVKDFNENIHSSYVISDFKSIIERYENDEFTNQASAESYNFLGLSYMEVDKSDEAIKAFTYALTILEPDHVDLEGAIYNNFSWAYNSINDYEKSIESAKKAIELGDVSAYVYTNYGNALLNLKLYEEAIQTYTQALEAPDYGDNFVYRMMAECYYQLDDYKNASIYFEKYEKIDPDNPQSLYDLGWSKALEANNYKAGLDEIDTMVSMENYSAESVLAKAEYLYDFEEYKLVEEFLTLEVEYDLILEDPDISYLLISVYDNLLMDFDAIELGTTLIKSGNRDLAVWYILLNVYYRMGDDSSAINLIKNYQVNSEKTLNTLLDLAAMYSYNYFYEHSNYILEDLIINRDEYRLTDDKWEEILYEWLLNLYDSGDYDKFIEVGELYKDQVQKANLYHLLGLGYAEIGDYDTALKNYYQSIIIDPEASYMYEDIVYLHIVNGDYNEARKYLMEAKTKGLDKDAYEEVNQYILSYMDSKPAELIFAFIEDNYMYYEDSRELSDLKNEVLDLDVITEDSFNDINQKAFGDDYFSFIISGDEFSFYMNMEEEATVISKWITDDHLYIDIDFFSYLTDTEFLRVLHEVDSPEATSLIIDVRGNYGGDLESAMNILDYLLGNQLIGDWDSAFEEAYPYYSDGNQIKFKQIFVLTDDESASSSEVLALGIREYIEGSKIIGETTFGKGVGQVSMNNLKYEYALFVVNAYWNINGKNIHEMGIQPDIELIDGTFDNYIEIIMTN